MSAVYVFDSSGTAANFEWLVLGSIINESIEIQQFKGLVAFIVLTTETQAPATPNLNRLYLALG